MTAFWKVPLVAIVAASMYCVGCGTAPVAPDPAASSEQDLGALAIAGTYPLLAGGEGLVAGTGITACFASLACGAVVVTGVVVVGAVYWLTVRPAEVGETPQGRIEFPAWLSASTYCPNVPRADWFPVLNARYERCMAASGGSACGPKTVADAGSLVGRLAKCIQSGGGSGCGTPAWVTSSLLASDAIAPIPEWDRENLNEGAASVLTSLDLLRVDLIPAVECREKNGRDAKSIENVWGAAKQLRFTARGNGPPLYTVVRRVLEDAAAMLDQRDGACGGLEDQALSALRRTVCVFYNIIRDVPARDPTGAVASSRAAMEAFFTAAGFECRP